MKALGINVLKYSDLRDCTNGGISSKYNTLLLICDEGYISIDENNIPDNTAIVEECRIGYKTYFHLRPYKNPDPNKIGYMMGGNFGWCCDSRFPFDYPLPIHDRQETQEEYDMLSR